MSIDPFVVRCEPGPGDGPTLAVKDLIAVAGFAAGAGCPAVAEHAVPAAADAACVAAMRAGGARVVGTTVLHELAAGANGVNPWYGTPANPLDPARVPGGSSSGSAVAVATGAAELALGTDTGGSVRIPAACCGICGLKTGYGRVPVDGVLALAPSLDTVGPLARDVAGLVSAMTLLDPRFTPARRPTGPVARLRGLAESPAVSAAVDAALQAAGMTTTEVGLTGWQHAGEVNRATILTEAAQVHHQLLADHPHGVSEALRTALGQGAATSAAARLRLAVERASWVSEIGAVLARWPVLALPTLLAAPPLLAPAATPGSPLAAATAPVNLAGLAAVSVPVPWPAGIRPLWAGPAALQLVGPAGTEAALLACAGQVERTLRAESEQAGAGSRARPA